MYMDVQQGNTHIHGEVHEDYIYLGERVTSVLLAAGGCILTEELIVSAPNCFI